MSVLPEHPREGLPIGRAAFLGVFGLGVAGIAAAPRLKDAFSGVGLPAGLGPGSGWRIYTVSSPMPIFDPATFQLKISGLVESPTTLGWNEIASLPSGTQTSTFHCVTGWSVDNVVYEGIRPKTLTDLVRPKPEATHVTFISLEQPYVDQITLDQFLLPDNILARTLGGAPVKREQGAPLRMVIPQMYGYKGVKWTTEIRFDDHGEAGFWEQRGYDADAWVGRSN